MGKTAKISGAVGTIAVFLLAGCSSAPTEFTTHGTLTFNGGVNGSSPWGGDATEGQLCFARTGYGFDDLTAGTQVKITDASGKPLALGQLAPGVYHSPPHATCVFNFTVPKTPKANFYGVTVGSRTGPQFTEAQMQAGPSLTVGPPPR